MTFNTGEPSETVYLNLTYRSVTGTEYTTNMSASDFAYEYIAQKDTYAYSAVLKTIAAKDMSCVVTAKIYDNDTLISNILEYSIETYALNRYNASQSESFKTLLVEMMKYGDSAEHYFINK